MSIPNRLFISCEHKLRIKQRFNQILNIKYSCLLAQQALIDTKFTVPAQKQLQKMSKNKSKSHRLSSTVTPFDNKKSEARSSSPSQLPSSLTFQFLSDRHSAYLNCPLCCRLMIQPIRVHRCGHTFCSTCIDHRDIKQCPTCLLKIQNKQKDILAGRLVGELPVRCLNVGCPWRGSYQQFVSFHEKGCKLKIGGIEAWLKNLQTVITENAVHNQQEQLQDNDLEQKCSNGQHEQDNHAQSGMENRKFQSSSAKMDQINEFKPSNIHEQSQKQKEQIQKLLSKKPKQFQQ